MRFRWLRLQAFTTLMLAIILLFSACSNSNNQPANTGNDNPAQPSQGNGEQMPDPVTLTLHTWFVGPNQALFDKFNEMYPWITIVPNTKINDGIINNIIAGEESDLVFLDNGLAEWMSGDLLEDLTPYIAKDERIQSANKVEGLLESFQTGGKQYTVPFSDIPMWVVVNKDLLHKNGLKMPSNDWTYDDFLELAKQATNPAAKEFGVAGMVNEFTNILAMANGNADNYRYLNADTSQSLANTPGVLADMQWSQDLSMKWRVRPTAKEMKDMGFDGDPGNAFLKGNFLFMLGADWYLPGLHKMAKFEWDVLPMPRGKARQATVHQAGGIAIPKASKHKEEAFLYISFLFDVEAQKIMIENGSNAFIIDEQLENYYEEVEMWKGKNVEAIKMAADMCCFSRDPTTVDLGDYMWHVVAQAEKMIQNGGNLNEIIPAVEAYNKQALETRKALGW